MVRVGALVFVAEIVVAVVVPFQELFKRQK
jgi:hypothetical protein